MAWKWQRNSQILRAHSESLAEDGCEPMLMQAASCGNVTTGAESKSPALGMHTIVHYSCSEKQPKWKKLSHFQLRSNTNMHVLTRETVISADDSFKNVLCSLTKLQTAPLNGVQWLVGLYCELHYSVQLSRDMMFSYGHSRSPAPETWLICRFWFCSGRCQLLTPTQTEAAGWNEEWRRRRSCSQTLSDSFLRDLHRHPPSVSFINKKCRLLSSVWRKEPVTL